MIYFYLEVPEVDFQKIETTDKFIKAILPWLLALLGLSNFIYPESVIIN